MITKAECLRECRLRFVCWLITVDSTSEVSVAVKEAMAKAGERLDVSEADIIISGGRGMGDPANFSHLNEVADVIGAAVGASPC